MNDDITVAMYRHRLEQFYGFYKPVEEHILGSASPLAKWLKLNNRHKTHFLEADLKVFGQKTTNLPLCLDLPLLNGAAECFGCLYVLEGATLGCVLIGRHIQEKLGVTAQSGGQFFRGYGEHTGAMWHAFRAAITSFSKDTDQQDVIVDTARETFEVLQHWCEKN